MYKVYYLYVGEKFSKLVCFICFFFWLVFLCKLVLKYIYLLNIYYENDEIYIIYKFWYFFVNWDEWFFYFSDGI